jgi:hypothetical protein
MAIRAGKSRAGHSPAQYGKNLADNKSGVNIMHSTFPGWKIPEWIISSRGKEHHRITDFPAMKKENGPAEQVRFPIQR